MLAVMKEGKLTRLWVRASALLPLGWHLAGVMRLEIATQWVIRRQLDA